MVRQAKKNSEQIEICLFSLDEFSDICGDVDDLMSVSPTVYVLRALLRVLQVPRCTCCKSSAATLAPIWVVLATLVAAKLGRTI